MENPIKMDDLGVPLSLETPILFHSCLFFGSPPPKTFPHVFEIVFETSWHVRNNVELFKLLDLKIRNLCHFVISKSFEETPICWTELN